MPLTVSINLLVVYLLLQPESFNKWHESHRRHSLELQNLREIKVKIGFLESSISKLGHKFVQLTIICL